MPNPSLAHVNTDELAQFCEIQQLAYQCVEAVGAMLRPGMTEKDAAKLLTEWLGDRGVRDWLHKPFAWFGDRTAFQGFSGLAHMGGFNLAFFPSSRQLEENMPVILDVAPVRNGVIADVGYAMCLGENAILEQLQDDLMAHRELIVRLVRERRSMADVARAVDQLCMKQGVEPRHKAYPFKVLAHRVAKLQSPSTPRFVARFGLNATRNLILDQVCSGKQQGWSPLWSIGRRSEHAPVPGLWAVEPHLGFHGVGAKFEELLVITEDDAYWLDDDLPHVRRWQQRQLTQQRAA
jgi:Xaa-Pro aminopeptidase